MNKQRRRRLADIQEKLDGLLSALQEIAEEEREYFDNMPESLQQSERGETAEEIADALETATDELETIIVEISSLAER